ncbi:MAG: hypothetical protein V4792_16620 [Pseudomonadota bacterium]
MAPQTPPPIDIVSLAIAVAALLFSPELSALIGPYVVILIGATLGAAWGASRRAPTTRAGSLLYVGGMVCVAVLVTVPAAHLSARFLGVHLHWLLGPVAAVVGGLGPDYLIDKLKGVFAAKLPRGDD